jgi:hypothetical protein
MNKSLKLLIYTSWLWLFLILFITLGSVDPVSAGPVGILLVFVLIYLIVASLLFTILHWGVRFVSAQIVKRGNRVTARSYKVSVRKAYYMASALAFGPVLLLALNSVRQLRPTDVLLVGLFLILSIFYISKRES